MSKRQILFLIPLLQLSQLNTVVSSWDCCTGSSQSVTCGVGIEKFPKPSPGDTPFTAQGYCGFNASNHFQVQPNLDQILSLEFSGASFTKLPQDIFRYFPRLETINLARNKFEVLLENAFYLPNRTSYLKELNLANNAIKSIHSGAFSGLQKLEKLTLGGNSLISSSIPENVFDSLINLKELHLGRNALESINTRWFQHLRKLEILTFDSNKIKSLPRLPMSMNSVRELVLNGNQIKMIADETLEEMINLRKLVLSSNQIEEIGSNAFEGSYMLQNIDIANNKLKTLSRFLFACLDDLLVLVLSNNQLTTAYPEWFARILDNCDKFNPVDIQEDPVPDSDVGGNPWKCDENMDELAILYDVCIDFELSLKRCAKRVNILCDGEGKSLKEVRNNITIGREKYEEMNITKDTGCHSFLPTIDECSPALITPYLSLSKIKYGLLVIVVLIIIVTLFFYVKYFKAKRSDKKKSQLRIFHENFRSPPDGTSLQGRRSSTEKRSISSDSDVSYDRTSETVPKPVFNPNETIPKCPYDEKAIVRKNRRKKKYRNSRKSWRESSQGLMSDTEFDNDETVTETAGSETRPKDPYYRAENTPSTVPNLYVQNRNPAKDENQSSPAPIENRVPHEYATTLGTLPHIGEDNVQSSDHSQYTPMSPLVAPQVTTRLLPSPGNPTGGPPSTHVYAILQSPPNSAIMPTQDCFQQIPQDSRFIPNVVYDDAQLPLHPQVGTQDPTQNPLHLITQGGPHLSAQRPLYPTPSNVTYHINLGAKDFVYVFNELSQKKKPKSKSKSNFFSRR